MLEIDIEKRLSSFTLKVKSAFDGAVSIVGPSGSGKSVTLKCIAGIMRPDHGFIAYNGRVLFDSERHIDLPPQKRNVGYLFQSYALFPDMSVRKNIEAGIMEKSRKARREKAEETAAMLHIGHILESKPHEISGGEAQRVALARSLASEPKILLLDEPLSALDAPLRKRLRTVIRDIHNKTGITMIYVTHDREEAFAISDRIIIMKDGSIAADGSPESLYNRPNNAFTASFTGDGTLLDASLFFQNQSGLIFFRPESVIISDEALNPEMYPSYLVINNVQITGVEYTGSHYLLCVDYNGSYILALSLVKPSKSVISLLINEESITKI